MSSGKFAYEIVIVVVDTKSDHLMFICIESMPVALVSSRSASQLAFRPISVDFHGFPSKFMWSHSNIFQNIKFLEVLDKTISVVALGASRSVS